MLGLYLVQRQILFEIKKIGEDWNVAHIYNFTWFFYYNRYKNPKHYKQY